MKLKIVFNLLFITFVGCANLPPKPNVNLCTIDIPRQQLICAPTSGIKSVDQSDYRSVLKYVYQHKNSIKIPLSQSDKFIAFSPDDWGTISIYMKELRDVAQNQCH